MTSILTLPSHMTGFLHELGTQSGIYSYVSRPRTMSPRERAEDCEGRSLTLMSDRRIIRGNTYSGNIPIMSNSTRNRGQISVRRRQLTPGGGGDRLRARTSRPGGARLSQGAGDPLSLALSRGSGGQEAAPRRSWGQGLPPVPGRRHVDNQTDSWLEAISDKKEDKEFGVQVNLNETWEEDDEGLFPGLKRLEVKTSHTMQDKETQIYSNDPHLFVFEDEVEIVLESIIGRTVEQSMTEVQHEEEVIRARKIKQDHMSIVKALSSDMT